MSKPTTEELAHIAAIMHKEKAKLKSEAGETESTFEQAAKDALSLWKVCHQTLNEAKTNNTDEILKMSLLPTDDYENHWDGVWQAMDDFERDNCISYQELVGSLWPTSSPKARKANLDDVIERENLRDIVITKDLASTKTFNFSIRDARMIIHAKARMVSKSRSENSKAGANARRRKPKKKK